MSGIDNKEDVEDVENHKDVENDIDIDTEEYLTEVLQQLYERWLYLSRCIIGTDDDKKETFLFAIRRRLEKGFSILTQPGLYSDEVELDNMLNTFYTRWQNYMNYIDLDPTIDIFINSIKNELDVTRKKVSWRDMAKWQIKK